MDSGNEQVIKSMTATDLHLILKNVTRVTTACADLKADATNCKATNRLSTSPVFFFPGRLCHFKGFFLPV